MERRDPLIGASMSEEASARASSSQSWQRWRRPGPTRKQLRIDVWLALGVLVGTAGTTVLVNSMGAFVFGEAPSLPEQLLWGLALSVPLAVRRRFPLVVLIVVGALFIGAQARHVGDNFMPSVEIGRASCRERVESWVMVRSR